MCTYEILVLKICVNQSTEIEGGTLRKPFFIFFQLRDAAGRCGTGRKKNRYVPSRPVVPFAGRDGTNGTMHRSDRIPWKIEQGQLLKD